MRILSLGAHDGYLDHWLQQRHDGDLDIAGMELMPLAAEKARERGVDCRVGRAEDAAEHFEPGSFDMVVAFEVLEHVVDMDRLLSACETMCKPEGRIVLSTPDGTFGTGHNPHHLRALRVSDLADLVRRHARPGDGIHALGSGAGVACASYTPGERRGDVGIFLGPCFDRWAPQDIMTRGLGGSETAAVRLAEQLSALGYVVTVYGDCEEGLFRDVLFRDWRTFDPMDRREALIASRVPHVFDRPVNARVKMLWVHDVDVGHALTAERAVEIDHVLVLSEWHEEHMRERYGPLVSGLTFVAQGGRRSARLARIRNGIHLPYFRDAAAEAFAESMYYPSRAGRQPRVLYTSSPDRGLAIILELWPHIREQVPEATLEYVYAPVYAKVAEADDILAADREKIRRLSNQPGVTALEPLPQHKLAKLMLESRVWVAPSWHTPTDEPFYETSCIGAMEAQAAGLCVVASGWGALLETVRIGELVRPPLDDGWRGIFAEAIVNGLTNPERQRVAEREGPKAVADLGWDGVARQVEGLIEV